MADAVSLEALIPKARLLGLVPLSMDTERAEKLRASGVDLDTAQRIYPSWVPDAVVMDCESVVEGFEALQRMEGNGLARNARGYLDKLEEIRAELTKIRVGTAGQTSMFPVARYKAPE